MWKRKKEKLEYERTGKPKKTYYQTQLEKAKDLAIRESHQKSRMWLDDQESELLWP